MNVPLEPDRAVPQRDLLLDPSFVRERLSHLLSLEIDVCRQIRVKYRVGARLRVVNRIHAGSASFAVSASTFRSLERSERAHEEALEQAVADGQLPPVVHDPELTTVFWIFPNDRKIAGLRALIEPASDLVALHPAWCRGELVSYAPEKAATVRCLDGRGQTVAYAKAYAGKEGARARRVHDALAAEDPYLKLPRAFGYSPRHRTLVVESVEGAPVHTSDPRLGYRRLGWALARLHELPPPDAMRFRRVDGDRLEAAAERIGSVRSDVATQARRLARDLVPRLDDEEATCLHGDVNFRNALLDNGRVALIDLDQVAAGPAAAELGSVLASLRYAGIVGIFPRSLVADLCASFLAGYAERRPAPDEAALRAYTAAALLAERALRVVTRIRAEGLRRLPALLAEAEDVLR